VGSNSIAAVPAVVEQWDPGCVGLKQGEGAMALSATGIIDCVVVGFNETDFDAFARSQRQFSQISGGYSELKTNSVLIGERRSTYMELLNAVMRRVTGKDSNLNAFRMPSLGVVYLVSYLRSRGANVEFINFFTWEKERLADMLRSKPRAVAITTTYYVSDEPIREIVDFVRQHDPSVRIIVGGPRVFNLCAANSPRRQDTILRAIGADIYIEDSQGEGTLASVLTALREGSTADLARVPNLIYVDDEGSFSRTQRVPERNDLDREAVNWEHFDPSFYAPTVFMRTARSCSFRCAFCNYPAMAGALTLSSTETVERELRLLVENGVRNVIFVDDTFNVPLPRFKQLLRMMIRNRFGLKWISFLRCSNVDDETFDLMAESGCISNFLGIESGDAGILKAMNKSATLDRYQHGIAELSKRGIKTLASLIVGYPGESERSVRNTIDFLESNPTTFYNVQLYYHDVLAPVEAKRAEYGIEQAGYSWRHRTMDWQEAAGWKDYMIANIKDSALLPLYGLSIWALPYLIDNGMSMEQVVGFAGNASRLVLKSLEDRPFDCSADLDRMARQLQPVPTA
jgi:radical SAM PhpK family P-methyltransferase